MQRVQPGDLHGIDVSRWQGEIDWKSVKADGIEFAYIKSGEGINYVDPKYFTNVKKARAAGIAAGAYHFARPDLNSSISGALKEAQCFIRTLKMGFGDFGDIYPVLDLEMPFPRDEKLITTAQLLIWANTFREHFEKQTRCRLMLYTGIFFIREYQDFKHGKSGHLLADMPLWIAIYPGRSQKSAVPPDAGNWSKWTVWQYTDGGTVKGVEGKVDLNRAVPALITKTVR